MKTPTAITPMIPLPAPISSRSQSSTKFLRRPGSKHSSSLDSTMLKDNIVGAEGAVQEVVGEATGWFQFLCWKECYLGYSGIGDQGREGFPQLQNTYNVCRAKYQPYGALRQRFWRQHLKQYDADDSGTISRLELTSMLNSLRSTLSRQTIISFFSGFDKSTESALTMNEGIQCLETELCCPTSEKKRINPGAEYQQSPNPSNPDFSGPSGNIPAPVHQETELIRRPGRAQSHLTVSKRQPLADAAINLDGLPSHPQPSFSCNPSASSSDADEPISGDSSYSSDSDAFERVISVKLHHLCYRQRMNSKVEARADRIVAGNLVTASQPQRKWYTKVIVNVAAGGYRLGANSANIIVQNQLMGELEEEKMQVYVRLGIRLLYKVCEFQRCISIVS
ncbi:hypothetical protein BDY19DRAFT_1052032, partial [Irpex rosettiformis]